jgi:hypothetical protein
MKQFNTILLAVISLLSLQSAFAQTGTLCDGNKGPNLLAARGTFSIPYITPNANADACIQSGTNSYNPLENVGSKIEPCGDPSGNIFPCSDYNYTAVQNGMQPEFTYSIVKIMGDESGSNCLHSPIWIAADHTGDQGYFLAVNGRPDIDQTPIFYQIKSIPVCVNAIYEFSAWVINMMPPGGSVDASPSISFVVNGTDTIGTSGHIPYDHQWHKVGGQFMATTGLVDLKVVNSTAVAGGNDLGLDDISFNVCQSKITVNGPAVGTEGSTVSPTYTITDASQTNTVYQWQVSRNAGITFTNITGGTIIYTNGVATLSYDITNVSSDLSQPNANGNIYRLVVAASRGGLITPDCHYFNDYILVVAEGGPTPVKLTSFNGDYSNGVARLNWQTSQELNNDRFELYRSYDGNNFELATSIAGAGNSSVPKNYTYQDHINLDGNVYYKLKQVDIDGKFSFSNIIKLSSNDAKASFKIYPNPVVNNFAASFSAPKSGVATLLIRNTSGQTVYKKSLSIIKGDNTVSIGAQQFSTGMYYINIINDEINYSGKLQKL